MTKLYYVQDRISGASISGFIPQSCDMVAVRNYIASFEKNKDDSILKFEETQLVRICELKDENYEVIDNTREVICNGKNAKEKLDFLTNQTYDELEEI